MPRPAASDLDRAFAVAERHVAEGTVPWGVLGVATRDRVVRVEAWGSGPDGGRVGTNAVALVASITKPILATAILQLVAEGRLSLVEPLERRLPEAAEAATSTGARSVTAWHLLGHTSGLADVEELLERAAPHAVVIRELLRGSRRAAPGATYAYATATFDVLAALLSRLDGRPYPDALRARVLEPLGMADTVFDPRTLHAARMIRPLDAPLPGGRPVPEPALDAFIGLAMPGAGLWSTAADLLRFGRAFAGGGELDGARILPPAFVELMTREVTSTVVAAVATDPGTAEHYALGWGKPGAGHPGSRAAFYHGGITGPRLWVDPPNDLVVAWLTGAWNQPGWTADTVVNAVYGALG